MNPVNTKPQPIILLPGEGRHYAMGKMSAVFKADNEETQDRYSVSEWWLEPNTDGPGAHSHDENDEIFYVLEGEPEILVGETWIKAPRGTFLRIPATVMHDFRNTTGTRAGLFNVFIPGGFEQNMPMIVEWFAENR